MSHRFFTLDVFTTTMLAGNPLAVVLDADDLNSEQMQRIASEFNLSETVFVSKAQNAPHSAQIRIFTPTYEMPFAGHPTVGTAILLAQQKLGAGNDTEHDAMIVLEEQIGLVRAAVKLPAGEAPFAIFDVPKLPEAITRPVDPQSIARALGLLDSDLNFDNHKISQFDAGVPYTFVPVRDREAVDRVRPLATLWEEAFGSASHLSAYVYCRETVDDASTFHARMLWQGNGVTEDPATGSAVAALAGAITKYEPVSDGEHRFWIEQGYKMGRPSQILLEVDLVAGRLEGARIGGHGVIVQEGELQV